MYGIIWVWAMASVMLFALGCWGLRVAWEIIKTGVVLVFAVFVVILVTACHHVEEIVEHEGLVVDATHITIVDRGVQVTYPAPRKRQRQSLPQKCAKFYADGTERWIDCMGVGYK